MKKTEILKRINKAELAQSLIPSIKTNGKPEVLGLCPYHDDTNPSMAVNIEKGLFYCHACKEKGDLFKLYQKVRNVDSGTALKEMGLMAGIVTDNSQHKIDCIYPYTDETGKLLYEVIRYIPKTFKQRRPDGNGGYIWNMKDVVLVPYNLPKIIDANTVCICEGEKDCDTLMRLGLVATTNPGGAGKWPETFSIYFVGKDVVIICDNDQAGRNHGYDVAAKLYGHAKSIKIIKFLPGVPEKGDVSDWLKIEGNSKDSLLCLVEKAPTWSPGENGKSSETGNAQAPIDPKNFDIFPAIKFPLNVLPSRLVGLVQRFAESLQVDETAIATIMLNAVSGAIGNSIRVAPKKSYRIAPFLWTILVQPSGYGKSHVISNLMQPIDDRQSDAWMKYKKEIAVYNQLSKKEKKDAEYPKLEQFYTSDVTTESLIVSLQDSTRGLLVVRDELSGLVMSLNQYKTESKGGDKQFFLELYNGGTIKVDRKTAGHFYIRNAGASVLGGIPPSVIPQIFGEDSINDGFFPRFLLVNDDSEPKQFSDSEVSFNDTWLWHHVIDQCYRIPLQVDNGRIQPTILSFEPGALELFKNFYNELMVGTRPFVTARVMPFIPKLITYSLKFAGILLVLELIFNTLSDKTDEKVSVVSDVSVSLKETKINKKIIEGAIEITRYFAGQAVKVLDSYAGREKQRFNEYERRIIRVLQKLENQVKGARLLLSIIKDEFNNNLPENLKHNSERITSLLERLGLETEKGASNKSCLIWETEKIYKLFSEITGNKTNTTKGSNDISDDDFSI